MRAVWGQASRPKLRSARLPRYQPDPNTAFTGFQLRPVTFNDVFGVFLAPFLAAATIVNLSWKEKQKKDWDTRLAEIDRELEALRAREIDAWNRIQLNSTTQQPLRHGRRSYSTVAAAPSPESADSSGDPYSEPTPSQAQDDLDPVQTALRQHATPNTSPAFTVKTNPPAIDEDVPKPVWELERLIATRLALEILLQVHTGDEKASIDYRNRSNSGRDVPPQHVANIVEQLQKVKELELAARIKGLDYNHFIASRRSDADAALGKRFWKLSKSYKDGAIDGNQFLEDISEAIVTMPEALDLLNYTALVKLLHDEGFTAFATLVVNALKSSRRVLDEVAFERIIEHAGHSRNVQVFDWCLLEFTKIHNRIQLSQRWEWHRISGEMVPVPSSKDPRLVKTLTFAALSLEQINRAEAWASVLRRDESVSISDEWGNIIKAFLSYYARHSDWERGRAWIWEVIQTTSLGTAAFRSFKDFTSLIFRMLSLCVACTKRSEYAEILAAAVEANIRPPEFDDRASHGPVHKIDLAIVSEWTWMLDSQPRGRYFRSERRVELFQENLQSSELYINLQDIGGGSDQSKGSPPIVQQAVLVRLTDQLAESKQKVEEQLENSRKLQLSLRTLLDEYVHKAEKESRISDSHQRPSEARFEEQQSALSLLQKELSRHRQLIESELEGRRREEKNAESQRYEIKKLQRDLESLKEQSGSASSNEDSDSLRELVAATQNEQMKKLERKVASLTKLIQNVLNTSPQSDVADASISIINQGTTSEPLSKSFANPHLEHTSSLKQDTNSDSGYSSDSSSSVDVDAAGNFKPADKLKITFAPVSSYASKDKQGNFIRLKTSLNQPWHLLSEHDRSIIKDSLPADVEDDPYSPTVFEDAGIEDTKTKPKSALPQEASAGKARAKFDPTAPYGARRVKLSLDPSDSAEPVQSEDSVPVARPVANVLAEEWDTTLLSGTIPTLNTSVHEPQPIVQNQEPSPSDDREETMEKAEESSQIPSPNPKEGSEQEDTPTFRIRNHATRAGISDRRDKAREYHQRYRGGMLFHYRPDSSDAETADGKGAIRGAPRL